MSDQSTRSASIQVEFSDESQSAVLVTVSFFPVSGTRESEASSAGLIAALDFRLATAISRLQHRVRSLVSSSGSLDLGLGNWHQQPTIKDFGTEMESSGLAKRVMTSGTVHGILERVEVPQGPPGTSIGPQAHMSHAPYRYFKLGDIEITASVNPSGKEVYQYVMAKERAIAANEPTAGSR